MRHPLAIGSARLWRSFGVFIFLVLGLLSIVLLAATQRRAMQTVEQSVAATDNLMSLRLALARAHLAWVRDAEGDPTVDGTRSLAELNNATGHLADLLEGRSALIGLEAEGLADDPVISGAIDSMTTAIHDLRSTLAERGSMTSSAAAVPLRFSALDDMAVALDRRVHEKVRATIQQERRAQSVFLAVWSVFLALTGLGIEGLRRARRRALAETRSAEEQRFLAEADLAETERRFENLRALTDAGVLLVDERGRIREMSAWWRQTLDMKEEVWVGRSWWEALHREEHPRMEDLWREKALRRTPFSVEARAQGIELGHDRWLAAHWKPVESGGLTEDGSWVGTVLDVTQHRTVEAQFQQAQKLEAIGRMTSSVAHDFNNLLTITLSNTEMLRSDPGDDAVSREELLQDIEGAAEAGRDLIAGLMSFSRKAELEIGREDLSTVVTDAMRLADKLIPDEIEIVLDLPDPGPTVHTDPRALQQILFNLVTNARDAMPDGGRLVISVDEVVADDSFVEERPWINAGRFGRLTVTDTGIGMDRETLDHIFEPFFSTKAEGSGTGLGLSSVHGLVRQQGGHIHAYSEIGVGTSFRVYLPLASGGVNAHAEREGSSEAHPVPDAPGVEAVEPPLSVESAASGPASLDGRRPARGRSLRPGVSRRSLHVLVVEDDDALRRSCERVLVRLGHSVTAVVDGDVALDLIAQDGPTFDVVISDISMDRIDGLELLRRTRQRGSRMPFVLTSGRHASQLVGDSTLPEDVVFLPKPWSVDTLKSAIEEARLRA